MYFRFGFFSLVAASAMTGAFGRRTRAPTPAPTKAPTPAPTKAPTPAPTSKCESIRKIACGADDFDFLCWALKRTDLDDVLDGSGSYTVFAPTDDAFRKTFGDNVRRALRRLPLDALEDLLLYHVYDEEAIKFADLGCDDRLTMANDERTRTKCRDRNRRKFQVGRDNDDWPEIIVKDVPACNGIIQVVDEVLLPKGFYNEYLD